MQVAMKLLEVFPNLMVCNLCGGLVAWFNAGHDMELDSGLPAEGYQPPEHLESFITREITVAPSE